VFCAETLRRRRMALSMEQYRAWLAVGLPTWGTLLVPSPLTAYVIQVLWRVQNDVTEPNWTDQWASSVQFSYVALYAPLCRCSLYDSVEVVCSSSNYTASSCCGFVTQKSRENNCIQYLDVIILCSGRFSILRRLVVQVAGDLPYRLLCTIMTNRSTPVSGVSALRKLPHHTLT